MKIEIEITADEIKSSIERKVRTAVADQTNNYGSDRFIRDKVNEHWKKVAEGLVVEELKDSNTLREKIAAQIEKKIRAQLQVAMKQASKHTC